MKKGLLQFLLSAGKARHHGADRNFQDLGDLVVGMLLKIKKDQRCTKSLVDGLQSGHDLGRFQAVDGFGHRDRQLIFNLGKFLFWPAHFATAGGNKFTIKRGEQPRLDLRIVAEKMPLGGPNREGLLGQIAGVRFIAGQAEGKAIEHGIEAVDNVFEIEGGHGSRTYAQRGSAAE